MALQDLAAVLHDVSQGDEATLSNCCVLRGEALSHMLPYSFKVGMRSLSHGVASPGLHRMEGVCRLTSS